MSTAFTFGIFIATLVLVLTRPRGWAEGWWAALGGLAMIALGRVTPRQAIDVIWVSRNAVLFLLALLLLSALLETSGFFEWAALQASRRAGGNGRRLFRNVFLLGALVTTTLSLDTTAVMLTPIVIAFVGRLRLPARPYIVGTAFVANIASLTLPISNLTNLLFADTFHLGFLRFVLRMLAPQLVAATATYALLRLQFRGELQDAFDQGALPEPSSVIEDQPYFRAATVVLGFVLAGYFVAPLVGIEEYVVAFAGSAVLGVIGVRRARVGLRTLREISWGLLPLVLGLFVVVKGVENLQVVDHFAHAWSGATGPSIGGVLVASGTAGVAANLMNNLPAALLARSVLPHGDDVGVFATLLGLNIGPTILPTGSLATLLVLDIARKKGARVRGLEIVKTGLWVTPIVLFLAAVTLAAIDVDSSPVSARALQHRQG